MKKICSKTTIDHLVTVSLWASNLTVQKFFSTTTIFCQTDLMVLGIKTGFPLSLLKKYIVLFQSFFVTGFVQQTKLPATHFCVWFDLIIFVQVAWYGRGKVLQTDAENGSVMGVDRSSAEDGTRLINESDVSSDDELFGLLDKPGTDRKSANGKYAVAAARDVSQHGVRYYIGNASAMLTGIHVNHSTVVQ